MLHMYYEYYYIFPSCEREMVLKNAPKMRNLCKKEIASNHELDNSYLYTYQYMCVIAMKICVQHGMNTCVYLSPAVFCVSCCA